MDYTAALKTVLTLAGFALLCALMAKFPDATAIVAVGAVTVVIVYVIVAIIYLAYKGDLPEI